MPPMPAPATPDEPAWAAVEELFLNALDCAAPRRSAVLDAEPDPGVRAAAASLLAALDSADGFLDGLGDRPLSLLLGDDSDGPADRETLAAGDRVGVWRLVREVGRGGMGVVWLAERSDGAFAQHVALKMLPGSGGAFGPRLVQERHTLARLAHPAIARLIDGGADADGRPFLAMEFVDGLPITEWADAHTLPILERVALFAEAVEAVRHAHRHLVVHRDLKPSNVFVAEGETAAGGPARPAVKLLDFGLARLLGPAPGAPFDEDLDTDRMGTDAAGEALTHAGVRPMTPEYAAPEQVRGDAITTATDVYALGVVLYELLVGRRPYAFPDRSAATITRVVETAQPELPSGAACRAAPDGTAAVAIAAARAATPNKLSRALRGDLDAVVLCALSKDPAERYASADALAQDLERWRRGRPVVARLGRGGLRDAFYRNRRFARRNRVAVVAVVALVVALGAGLVGTLVQARAARVEAARANAARDFVLGVFAGADPAPEAGGAVTARALLDAAAASLPRDLAAQPDLRAEMELTLGGLYGRLTLYEPALELLRASVRDETAVHRGAHPHTAEALDQLSVTLLEAGDGDAAEAAAHRAVAMWTAVAGVDDPRTAETTIALVAALGWNGHPEEAERLLRPALAILRRSGSESLPLAVSRLATLRQEQDDLDEAEALAREAVWLATAQDGAEHLDTIALANNLALILRDRGDLDGAERGFRHVLAVDIARLGPDHVYVATASSNLALTLIGQRRFREAEPLLRRVVAIDRARLGDRHPYTALAFRHLAEALRGQGRLAEAAASIGASAARYAGSGDAGTPWAGIEGARIALAQGDAARAERLFAPAESTLDTLLDAGDGRRAHLLSVRAQIRGASGDADGARRLHAEAVSLARRAYGLAHFRTLALERTAAGAR